MATAQGVIGPLLSRRWDNTVDNEGSQTFDLVERLCPYSVALFKPSHRRLRTRLAPTLFLALTLSPKTCRQTTCESCVIARDN